MSVHFKYIFSCACGINLLFAAGYTQQLSIRVEDIKQGKGDILIAIFNTPNGFPYESGRSIAQHRAIPENGTASLVIPLAAGRYAIALFQDSNNDGKLNTNFLGIPKEGYGVSNNAYNLFSAPEFKEAAFDHKGKTSLTINMKY